MPRELPELVAEIWEQVHEDAPRMQPRGQPKQGWLTRAERLLIAFARGDTSAFKRTTQQKRAMLQELLKQLQPWKGPNARALKKELRDDHGRP